MQCDHLTLQLIQHFFEHFESLFKVVTVLFGILIENCFKKDVDAAASSVRLDAFDRGQIFLCRDCDVLQAYHTFLATREN